ncbi:hypothetical protein GCM10018789_59500 [Streptomyces werraensis]|nr:hypothetical protein GCM10018789_59500 [Streptomyces werraensis]
MDRLPTTWLWPPLKGLGDRKAGVRCVGVDGSQARCCNSRPPMFGHVGVFNEDLERVLAGFLALKGLQSSDALSKRSTGLQRWKSTPVAVIEPSLKVSKARAGGHLDAAFFCCREGPSQQVLHFGVHGVFKRSTQLGEGVSDKTRNRLREWRYRSHDCLHLIAIDDVFEGEWLLSGVVVNHPYDSIDRLIDMSQGRHNMELVVRQPGIVSSGSAHV